ncbi:MAG TPA: hypothetical protein VIM87_17085 [Chitinophaga sp.]|uniref:hypothetical protein n=1 Tax=Chitinophaga sp. TaxID=1869181 RepID=UPI002F92E771
MKKILLAFDDGHYSKGAFEFARRLNEIEPILLTGVFLPQVDFTGALNYANGGAGTFLPIIEEYYPDIIARQVKMFSEACVRHQIEFRVHKDRFDFAMPELRKETRFADLLILGSEKFYSNIGAEIPNEYLRMALHEAECPVILAPEDFNFPASNVLAYDGSADAVYAIKSFSSLFPNLSRNSTTLVYSSNKPDPEMPDLAYIQELAARHFSDLTLELLNADPGKYFETWLSAIKDPILVCGSFGRSGISRTFKHSFVTQVTSSHRLPVFITHR